MEMTEVTFPSLSELNVKANISMELIRDTETHPGRERITLRAGIVIFWNMMKHSNHSMEGVG